MKLDILKDKIIEKGFDYKSLTEPLNLDYQTIMKKMRAEKLKKMIESELKQDKKKESVESIFDLSFKSM